MYKNCYSNDRGVDAYRPLFWYSNKDKREYEELFGIKHSDCYEVWGFTRTGCVGCPYNKNIEHDLEIVKEYEPNMYKVCQHLFGRSYEYTKEYRAFKEEFKAKQGSAKNK